MKKILAVTITILAMTQGAKADWLTDQIDAAFVGSAKTAVEFTSHGQTQYEFLSNFMEIGKLNKGYIAAIDLGVLGTQLPDETVLSVQWTGGAKLHFSPIIKNYITLNPAWEFINNLEIDGRYSYNFTSHHPTLGISIGYPFK